VIGFVHVGELRKPHLIAATLIFQFVYKILAPSDNVDSVVQSVIVSYAHEIG
jgi:hypothetical protein